MGIATATGSLAAGESRTFYLAPASTVTLVAPPNTRATVTETPATVTASGVGGDAKTHKFDGMPRTVTYGPYAMGGTVVVAVLSNSGATVAWTETSAVFAPDGSGLVGPSGKIIVLRKPSQTLKKCIMGKVKSVATSAADHTTRVMTVLEAPTERIRIGIINPVAAELVDVRVRITGTDTMLGLNTSLAGTLSGSSSTLSAKFNCAAGTDAVSPKITWSEWMSTAGLDRIDGGTLPVYMIAVEIPGASNANRPAWDNGGSARSGWEDPANTSNRPWKQRTDAVLGATTNTLGTSTAYGEDGMPFIIEYMPRVGSLPLTLTCIGDSIIEGSGATVRGHGFPYIARALVSTPTRPVEICNLAVGGATQTEMTSRLSAVIADITPELILLAAFSPNGISAPTFAWASTARGKLRDVQTALQLISTYDAVPLLFSGVPMLSQAGDSASGNKDLNASGATDLARYMALILDGQAPVVDCYTPMSGPADADGQVTFKFGTTADGLHPNDTGHAIMAAPLAAALRSVA